MKSSLCIGQLVNMHDILETDLFFEAKERILKIVARIKSADSIAIFATADLESVIALSFLESAMLDEKIGYSRKVLPSIANKSKSDNYEFSAQASLIISIEQYEETWKSEEIDESNRTRIVPLAVSVTHPNSDRIHNGALDVVIQSAAIAAAITPNGGRVRRLRHLAGTGHWLRDSLDKSYDPIHTKIRDILQNEGTIRLLPLPEIERPIIEMIPGLSQSMLQRLAKKWSKMDFEQRQQGLSELALQALSNTKLSTPRLEELIWFRELSSDNKLDLHSHIFLAKAAWPDDHDEIKPHAIALLKGLITTGQLTLDSTMN